MKRIILLACMLVFIGCAATAQVINARANTLQDYSGKTLMNTKVTEIDGTYLLYENFQPANVLLANGDEILNLNVKLDLKNNRVYYKNDKDSLMEAGTRAIKRITFVQNGDVYENGFPPLDNQDEATFYRVVTSGKASLLVLTSFVESEYKEFNSAVTTKKIDKVNQVFGVSRKTMIRLTNEGDVRALLSDKGKDVYDYILKNKLKCKKQGDYENVIKYYNSL